MKRGAIIPGDMVKNMTTNLDDATVAQITAVVIKVLSEMRGKELKS